MADKLKTQYEIIDFCCGHPFTHKREVKNWISALKESNRESCLFSISALNKLWAGFGTYWDDELDHSDLVKIQEISEIERTRSRARGRRALIIFLFPPTSETRWIWRKFNKAGYDMGFLTLGPLPFALEKPGGMWVDQVNSLKSCLRFFRNPIPDVWISSGNACIDLYANFVRLDTRTKHIHAHSFDYEKFHRFQRKKNKRTPYKQKALQFLFLDQGFTTHPDRLINPHGGQISIDGTYKPIIKFLKQVERRFKSVAVVAGHPKASIEATRKIFGDVPVEFGSTLDLVSQSDVIVSHSSTAVQWAVLLMKPIILLSTEELKKTKLDGKVAGIANILKLKVVNVTMENDAQLEHIPKPDRHSYLKYIHDYVKAESSMEESLENILVANL